MLGADQKGTALKVTEFKFTPETLILLRDVGWSEDYRFDVEVWRDYLKSIGCDLHKASEMFLSRFGNLRINYPTGFKPVKGHNICLDPTDTPYDAESMGFAQRVLGKNLTVLGTCEVRYMTLSMATNGAVYGITDGGILHIASSGEQAIDDYCMHRRLSYYVPEEEILDED